MPRSKRSPIEQSYKLQMELIPLFASSIPAASRKQLARRPPKGPMLAAEIERHIEQLKAHADAKPIVYISSRKSGQILKTLGIQIQTKELPQFAKEINSAFLEYSLRCKPNSFRCPVGFQDLELLLLFCENSNRCFPARPRTPKTKFCSISLAISARAMRHLMAPHSGLPPYELADPLHNFPFTVNYRSDERLEQTITGVNEVTAWMQSLLDARVSMVSQSN